jgi:hypothetical protein
MDFTEAERELLSAILEDRLSGLREEIYHTDDPGFKDQLKRKRIILQGLMARLKDNFAAAH